MKRLNVKHSIRHSIMLIFVGVMAAMMVSIWAIDNFWLEKYYVNKKLAVMEDFYNEIDQAVMEQVYAGESIGEVIEEEMKREWAMWGQIARSGGKEKRGEKEKTPETSGEGKTAQDENGQEAQEPTILEMIRGYGEKNNINTVLIDSNTGHAMFSSGAEAEFLVQKVQRYVLGIGDKRRETLVERDNYIVQTNYDFRTANSLYMECWGFLSDNSTLVMMSMPLASIRESVALSNRFITYVGLVVLAIGGILMYFATKRVTTPILNLAVLSERMSHLDFDANYEENAQDEIGVLGRSMNTLSDKLKETISELQAANRQLQKDIEEKIQIDELRKEFIANVSHELKTPIALIQGYAEGLTEGMGDDAESRNYYCEVIMDEADKMNRMVKQLLNLTELEFGKEELALSTFDITELVEELIHASHILLEQNQAKVSFEAKAPVFVLADEFKIEEVLTNYLTNAIHHLDGERAIRLRIEEQADTAIVYVYNSGAWIPEEDLPNLWTKFYKVDKARTRTYGGSGIGLSIVKAIMDKHQQECGVTNVEGGVEFWFSLKKVCEKLSYAEDSDA